MKKALLILLVCCFAGAVLCSCASRGEVIVTQSPGCKREYDDQGRLIRACPDGEQPEEKRIRSQDAVGFRWPFVNWKEKSEW
jgi:hypothetical protein